MTRWRVFVARVAELVGRRRVEHDWNDELRHHLDLLTDHHRARGLSDAEARRVARLEFGSVVATTEAVRDRRGFRVVEALSTDMRRAVRRLAATPGLTAAVVLILGLGIGVNLAIFSLVYAAMFRPLPYPEPDRLVALWETAMSPAGDTETIAVAPANLADYRTQTGALATLAGYTRVAANVTGAATPERLGGEAVMPGYFEVLGGSPRIGRTFTVGEFTEGQDAVVVLSESLWRTGFGEDPAILGRRLVLDGRAREIVGVLPDAFVAVSMAGTPDRAAFYIPLVYPPDMMTGRGEHLIRVVGRLAPGVSVEALDAAIAAIARTIAATEPRAANLGAGVGPLADHPGGAADREVMATLMAVLVAAVGLVLVATCANVASLLLVRSFGRMREVAVRVALGASRARVRLEWFAESLVLATLGAAAGVGFAVVAMRLLIVSAPAGIPNLDAVTLDWRVLLVALIAAIGSAFTIGLAPAWHLGRTLPMESLRGDARTTAGRGLGRAWSTLLFAEVAVSALLLVGAGLMTRSVVKLNAVELGFTPDHVLALNVPLPAERYPTGDARLAFFESAAERLRLLPGIEAVTFANRLPLRGNWSSGLFVEPPPGQPPSTEPVVAGFQAVSHDYFEVLGIRAVAGRLLEPTDRAGAPPVAVVSRAFSTQLLGGADPIGRRFQRFPGAPAVTIVGVIGDLRRGGREAAIEPQVYLPAGQPELYPVRLGELAIRTNGRALPAEMVRTAIWAVDADQPVTSMATLDEVLALGQAERRFQATLFVLFAALAVALATVGTYSIVATAVSERTPEIGLRMALGAGRIDVLGWIVGRAGRPVLTGAIVGLAAAWWLSASVASLLFGVTPTDVPSYVAAGLLLLVVGTAAGLLAGRRATKIDPVAVLK